LSAHRLYFSHSYNLEDLPFNEHVWKLLMAAGFYTWIDTGREVADPNDIRPGARLPMDISFNEWMMSQCDGFVVIAPKKRQSPYQLLEYRIAVRMGVPRLVALEQGGIFDALDAEIIDLPTSWNRYWEEPNQSAMGSKIAAFATSVEAHKSAGEVLRSIGRWRPRRHTGMLTLALLPPRAESTEWVELQGLLQRNRSIQWTLLSPRNLETEQRLLKTEFDLLVLDIGPRGTPRELVGYVHALGIPQIRLCRVENEKEDRELGRFLDPEEQKEGRLPYEQDRSPSPHPSVPRFLDGSKLDSGMQPVVFWKTPNEAADQILETMRRVLKFRSGLSPEEGGIAAPIDTHQSAKKYFEQHYQRAERASVFISFAGRGEASKLADRLAQILRFLNLRCFHYRDPDSHTEGRLESGEDVKKGLEVRVNEADIVIYLIEDRFVRSDYCRDELAHGRDLQEQGKIELRAYRLDTLTTSPEEIGSIAVHEFRNMNWSDTNVEQKIVDDVQRSVAAIGWVLREKERNQLWQWLMDDGRDSAASIVRLLRDMGVPDAELKTIENAGSKCLDAVLRLPRQRAEQKRARQIAALLLLAATHASPDRRKAAAYWLYARHLLRWPPLVRSDNEDSIEINDNLITNDLASRTTKDMIKLGQRVAQKHPNVLSGRRPLCVTAKTEFLAVPVEWACETQHDQPIAVRRPIRWRLADVDTRPSVFESIPSNAMPPTTLILALAGPNINPGQQARQLNELLRARYEELGWPPELVAHFECQKREDVLTRLNHCQRQVIHLAGHMGGEGLQVGNDRVDAHELAEALRESDARMVILNGCEGGKSTSPVAVDYLTLTERLIRDAAVPEVVAHRNKINDSDALNFAKAFHTAFFDVNDGFEPARAAFKARKAGSAYLRYSPVVISQRRVHSAYRMAT
jgi:hypothetical protein